ncbi:hypothetical protein [Janthinobacterium sp. PAMC25594]|uniref:hypothetical protein n=1 Tax=Janthinobacterium sp. PAMC25594 TaxID=2861284 RepID=UPI001C63A326|nr:hypothetical protein [Janthinobacterium sp. PAMC25594]QYG07501.1 hypothetical protein KY494_01315 [Janthinobacterium sp. PAMC25594]
MGAPIIIDGSMDLWITNGSKDLICEIVVNIAKLEGKDISEVYDIAPGIAGTYGVSGLGIDTEEFYPYFGGRDGFRRHLDCCLSRLNEVCDGNDPGTACVANILAWAIYKMDGGVIDEECNLYYSLPPLMPAERDKAKSRA